MKIVADDKIPFLRGVFEKCAEVVYLPGAKMVYWSSKSFYGFAKNNPLKCPSDTRRENHYQGAGHYYSYGTNYYTCWNLTTYTMQKLDKLKGASRFMYLAETLDLNNFCTTFSANTYPLNLTKSPDDDRLEFRHNNSLNALFMDLHVQNMPYRTLAGTGEKYTYFRK